MNCSCGGVTEYTHKVQRNKKVVGIYQKCPVCGRILWLKKDKVLVDELLHEVSL